MAGTGPIVLVSARAAPGGLGAVCEVSLERPGASEPSFFPPAENLRDGRGARIEVAEPGEEAIAQAWWYDGRSLGRTRASYCVALDRELRVYAEDRDCARVEIVVRSDTDGAEARAPASLPAGRVGVFVGAVRVEGESSGDRIVGRWVGAVARTAGAFRAAVGPEGRVVHLRGEGRDAPDEWLALEPPDVAEVRFSDDGRELVARAVGGASVVPGAYATVSLRGEGGSRSVVAPVEEGRLRVGNEGGAAVAAVVAGVAVVARSEQAEGGSGSGGGGAGAGGAAGGPARPRAAARRSAQREKLLVPGRRVAEYDPVAMLGPVGPNDVIRNIVLPATFAEEWAAERDPGEPASLAARVFRHSWGDRKREMRAAIARVVAMDRYAEVLERGAPGGADAADVLAGLLHAEAEAIRAALGVGERPI